MHKISKVSSGHEEASRKKKTYMIAKGPRTEGQRHLKYRNDIMIIQVYAFATTKNHVQSMVTLVSEPRLPMHQYPLSLAGLGSHHYFVITE